MVPPGDLYYFYHIESDYIIDKADTLKVYPYGDVIKVNKIIIKN